MLEQGFRDHALLLLCCTTTLAAGVNLPCRRVLLRSVKAGGKPKDKLGSLEHDQVCVFTSVSATILVHRHACCQKSCWLTKCSRRERGGNGQGRRS